MPLGGDGCAVAAATDDLPEGLLYRQDFISADEEQDLLSALSSIDFRAVVMRGQASRRTVHHFGLNYNYENGELVPADPLPESMLWLRDRCAGDSRAEHRRVPMPADARARR